MQKNEAVHPKLTQIAVSLCLVLILLCSLRAQEKAGDHTESEGIKPAKTEMYSLFFESVLRRPPSLWSLTLLIEEVSESLEIQPFRAEGTSSDRKTGIQFPYSSKPYRFEQTAFTTSLVTLTALNIVDAVTTMEALKHNGLTEWNPIMKPFAKNVYLFTTVKLGVTAFNCYLLKKLHQRNKALAWVLSMTANLVMSYVLANNIRMIRNAGER